ncbi:hypothetical protein [Burkholderia phage FLC9]|nr:hypothetical protein [Burkholderia phage FLC9]
MSLPNLHYKEDKKITVTDPNEFVKLLERKASSNPLRKKLKLFIESVAVMAAGGWRTSDVRMQNTLVPGIARVGGSEEWARGYLWECAAIQPNTSEAPTTGLCFLTLNERGLFDRLYGNNPEADASLLYADFIADPEENKDLK